MEKRIFSLIGLTMVLSLSGSIAQSAVSLWHEHTDNLKIISIERVDSTRSEGANRVAMAR